MLLASTNVLTRYLRIKYRKRKNTVERERKQWTYASAARTFTELCKQTIERILWLTYEYQRL